MACSTTKAIEWDQAWSSHLDPSGRAAFGIHNSAYEQQHAGANNNIPANMSSVMPRVIGVPGLDLAIKS